MLSNLKKIIDKYISFNIIMGLYVVAFIGDVLSARGIELLPNSLQSILCLFLAFSSIGYMLLDFIVTKKISKGIILCALFLVLGWISIIVNYDNLPFSIQNSIYHLTLAMSPFIWIFYKFEDGNLKTCRNCMIALILFICLWIIIYPTKSQNIALYIATLFPFILLVGNRYIKYGLILLVMVLVIVASKMSAVVCIAGSIVIFGLISFLWRYKAVAWHKRVMVLLTFVTVTIIILTCIGVTERVVNMLIVDLRSGGSGRNTIIASAIEYLGMNDLLDWTIGHGLYSTLIFVENKITTHNDVLELIFAHGILGLITYSLFVFEIIKTIWMKFKKNEVMIIIIFVSIYIFIVMSMINHLILYQFMYFPLLVLWAIYYKKCCNSSSAKICENSTDLE